MSIFSVGLSLRSETLSLQELTQLAGAAPTRSHEKGDVISTRTPSRRVNEDSFWQRKSGVNVDTWTLELHWPAIAPILERLVTHDLSNVTVVLAVGTNARGSGFAFDIEPEKIALLAAARAGIWIDSYESNRDRADLPDDYPFPEGGTRRVPVGWRRVRRRINLAVRNINPFGKVRRHRRKALTASVI